MLDNPAPKTSAPGKQNTVDLIGRSFNADRSAIAVQLSTDGRNLLQAKCFGIHFNNAAQIKHVPFEKRFSFSQGMSTAQQMQSFPATPESPTKVINEKNRIALKLYHEVNVLCACTSAYRIPNVSISPRLLLYPWSLVQHVYPAIHHHHVMLCYARCCILHHGSRCSYCGAS